MKIKNVIGIAVSLAMVLTAAGCGKTGIGSTAADKSATATASIVNTEVKKAEKPVEISFSHWRSEDKESYAKVYQKFKEKYPNITVTEEILPSADYNKVLQTRLAAGAASDIFGINGVLTNGPKFNAAGNLEPLNSVANIQNIKKDYNDKVTDANGNQFAAIASVVNYAIMYNTDLFQKAGVQPPKTWDEFLSVCKALKDKQIDPMAVGGKDAYVLNWIMSMIQVNDYMVKDPDAYSKLNQRKAKYTELPALKSSMEKFEALVKMGAINTDQLGLSYDDSIALFSQGKAAMLPAGSFTTGSILKANPSIKLGAFNIPGEKGENANWVYIGMSYAVNKSSADEKKEAAKTFLNFVLEKDVAKQFSEETAMFTTEKDIELSFKDSIVSDYAKLVNGQTYIFPPMDPTVVDATWSGQQGSDLQALVIGKMTIDDILKDLDTKILKK